MAFTDGASTTAAPPRLTKSLRFLTRKLLGSNLSGPFLSQSDEFGCSGKQTCSSLRILRHTRPSGKSDDFLGVNSGATNQYPCNHHPQNSGLWLTAACL